MYKFELNDFAQMLAIIGVIISLAFVGLEINQNTNLARNQAYLEYVESLKELSLEIATDEILPGLVARLGEGELEEDFSAEDNVKIPLFQNATVRVWEGLYRSWSAGYLPQEAVANVGGGNLLNNDYFRQKSWPEIKVHYSPDFITFFEKQAWNSE
ncbi:MAG: hypothetical protein P8R01_08560 [Gammaproteobacteria bacterium]|nr:hypothetical protein [Gammaproteobacteria bacterium]